MVSARPSPARSAYKQQSLVLAEVKAFDRAGLRHVEATRTTDLSGAVHMETNQRLQVRRGRRRWGGVWRPGSERTGLGVCGWLWTGFAHRLLCKALPPHVRFT